MAFRLHTWLIEKGSAVIGWIGGTLRPTELVPGGFFRIADVSTHYVVTTMLQKIVLESWFNLLLAFRLADMVSRMISWLPR